MHTHDRVQHIAFLLVVWTNMLHQLSVWFCPPVMCFSYMKRGSNGAHLQHCIIKVNGHMQCSITLFELDRPWACRPDMQQTKKYTYALGSL